MSNKINKIFLISFSEKNAKIYFALLLLVGLFVRIYNFGATPCGFNQDEAFAGYEAYSLLNFGVDSAGYHNPVYFVAWGSGMNTLESYFAIPFMKLFGCSVVTLRLPQLLLSCLSLPIFYLLLKRIFSYKTALLGLALLTISPWHIMLGRWGLESNLAPSLLLLALYFFIRGITDNKLLVLSSIFFGLTLYCYAITWVVVPLTLLLFVIYLLATNTKISPKFLTISIIILFVLALPLILFLLVNKDIIPEIATNFISIPKLLSMRDGEITLKNLFLSKTYENFFNIFIHQVDGLPWNCSQKFGMFYQISLPFLFIGLARNIINSIKSIRHKKFSFECLILLGFLSSLFVCLLISNLNINKANYLHFYTLIFIVLGLKEVFILAKKIPLVMIVISCCYAVSFLFFTNYYFTDYNSQISYSFRNGVQDALAYANTQSFEIICLDDSIFYPQVLFFEKVNNTEFSQTVKYKNYPATYLSAKEFTHYRFGIDELLRNDTIYIIKNNQKEYFEKAGYTVTDFENYSVATIK